MNTNTYILTKEQFQQYAAKFASKANSDSLAAHTMILHNILRNKDARRGFTPITNPTKLSNGADEWQGYKFARQTLLSSLRRNRAELSKYIGIEVTDDLIQQIAALTER